MIQRHDKVSVIWIMWCLCKEENTDQLKRIGSSEADSHNENYYMKEIT